MSNLTPAPDGDAVDLGGDIECEAFAIADKVGADPSALSSSSAIHAVSAR